MKKILMMLLIVCFIILVCYRTDEIVADDSNEPYIVSKWGSGPIVAHYLSMCPSADAAPVSLAKCYSR